jgi:L-fuculose-phosphate aldolase
MVRLSTEVEQLKEELILACKILDVEGLFDLTGAGHPSARIPGTRRFIMPGHVHVLGKFAKDITSIAELLTIDLNGRKLQGKLEPMDEMMIHLSLYRARDDINGVVYVHPLYSCLFCMVNEEIHPTPELGSSIPMVDAGGPITTEEDGKVITDALGKRKAILVRGLGGSTVTVGKTLREAVHLSVLLERQAKMQYMASLLGPLVPEQPRRVVSHSTHDYWTAYLRKLTQSKKL